MRLLKVVVALAILMIAGLAGYAYFGDMKADPQEMRVPVELDLGNVVAQSPPAGAQPAATEGEAAATPDAAPTQDASAPAPNDLD